MSLPSTPRASVRQETWAGRPALVAFGIGALVAAVFAVYWPAITAGFVFDDDVLIVHNPSLEASNALNQIWCTTKNYEYLPLTYTSFLIERRLWGDSATGFHLVSLVLHAMNALLVWQVLRQLRVSGAWLAALLFAVHPVAASSVAWVSEQKNLWGLLFFLTSLSCYLMFQSDGRRRWYALSLTAFLVALLGKTSIVLGPVMILICIWWQTGRIRLRDGLLMLPYFLLSVAAGLVTIWFQQNRGIAGGTIPIGDIFERFEAAGYAVWFYAAKALVPVHLSMIYPQWDVSRLSVWPSLGVAVIAAVSWRFRTTWGRTALFAGGCYLVMLLPVLGFIEMSFMKFSLVADHFQYPALPVAMALVAAIFVCGIPNDRVRLTTAGIVAFVLGALTWQQAGVYRDDESLWTENLRLNPEAWAAHNGLGKALAERKDWKGAIWHFSEAVRLKPDESNYHYMLGTALMDSGDDGGAVAEFTLALKRNPGDYRAEGNLAHVLDKLGRFQDALEHAKAAVTLAPDSPETHYDLGNSLAAVGDLDRAIVEYRTSIRLRPGDPWAEIGWSKALIQLDRPAEAVDHAQAALKINPNLDEAHYELGIALMDLGDPDQAALQYREAIRLNPNDAGAHNNLADLLNRQHEPAEAAYHALAAIQINRNLAEAHFNLGNAYAVQLKRAEAASEYREAIRLRPNYPEARANLRVVTRGRPE